MSSAPGSCSRHGSASASRDSKESAGRDRASASGWLTSHGTSTPAEAARSPISASTTPSRAPQCRSRRSTSAVLSLWLTGTSVAPAYQAPNAAKRKAGVLYVITASRSPGRSPASRSTVAARRALSANSRYVHRRSP